MTIVTIVRDSRSGGRQHVMHLIAGDRLPIDMEHPCTCNAGIEGKFCWAVLEALRESADPAIRLAAANVVDARAAKSVKNRRSA